MANPIHWRPSDLTQQMLTDLMDHYNLDMPGVLGMAVASLHRAMLQKREDTQMDKTLYTAYAQNDQGATTNIGVDMDHPTGGKQFFSINAAATAARSELGKGWRVHIITDRGEEVKTFAVKK